MKKRYLNFGYNLCIIKMENDVDVQSEKFSIGVVSDEVHVQSGTSIKKDETEYSMKSSLPRYPRLLGSPPGSNPLLTALSQTHLLTTTQLQSLPIIRRVCRSITAYPD
ncbi:uncharacterized protein LOC110835682 isoform X2 [Zootermopsis nevadensis]|uniref:uncharacterized protein LOC110835682 isoform X2 n=1 Tax=Zootermopsis nevadensis TaxID=136037 RepID=UPI000B8E70AA|nr:uncharacterized protein LOC110835682 isoform X2 [Zootermopsis nevadensis]